MAASGRLIAILMLSGSLLFAENWPQFRGLRGDGTSLEKGILTEWDAKRNVLWKTALPGAGHSSPVVWGQRIFLTASAPDRSSLGFLIGKQGKLLVVCLDADTGKILWQREIEPTSMEATANGNGPATPTPATDGKYVFVYFGSYGVLAFDWNGQKVWDVKLGPYPHHMGTASSPVLSGEMLILNVETDGPDFLMAMNKRDGTTLWKTPRKQRQAGYSTPIVVDGRIFVAGHETVKAYDGASGRELWAENGMSTYVVPTPVFAHGLLLANSAGPGGSALLALRPDGSNAWRADRAASYVASPVVAGDWLFTVKDNGIMSCVDMKTGGILWQQRLPEKGTYYASPVTAEGRIYVLSEDGTATVVAAQPEFKVLSTNRLGDRCWASPAIANGRMYIRSDSSLFAIGSK